MSHYLHRSTARKPPVADAAGSRPPLDIAGTVERRIGTTREPRSRVLKPPIA